MRNSRYVLIPLNQLCSDGETLPVSYPLSSPFLQLSLQQMGLITPLLVQPLSEEKYQVICGHRRLLACREAGISAAACRVLEEAVSKLDALLINLHDNLGSRVFNPIEQSLIISKLEKFLPPEQVIHDYLPLLGLHPHPKVREKLLPLASLEDPIRQAVAKETLHPDTAYQLACLNALDRQAVFELLQKVHLSTREQQELIEHLQILKGRENTPIAQLLAHPALQGVIQNQQLSMAERGAQARRFIRQRCFPLSSQAQQAFQDYKKQLGLPPGMHLTAPPFFEKDQYKLNLSFRSPEELKSQTDKLQQIAASDPLKKIIRLGKKI